MLGVIDLEVAKSTSADRNDFVYAAGIYTHKENKPMIFYIDSHTRDSDKVILDMLDNMFSQDVHTYYCHNLAMYDIFFRVIYENYIDKSLVLYKDKSLVYNNVNAIKIDINQLTINDNIKNIKTKDNTNNIKVDNRNNIKQNSNKNILSYILLLLVIFIYFILIFILKKRIELLWVNTKNL